VRGRVRKVQGEFNTLLKEACRSSQNQSAGETNRLEGPPYTVGGGGGVEWYRMRIEEGKVKGG